MDRASRVYWKRAVRRTLAWVVLPAALLLGFRLYWGYHAERRLAATLEHLRALHIRYTPEEFPDGAAVPAEENAVNALLSGPLEFNITSAEYVLIQDPLEYQTPDQRAAVVQLLAREQKRLDRIDEAARRPQVVWPRQVFDPSWNLRLAGLVAFGRLLEKGARIAHEQHDDAQALRQLERLLAVARVMEKSPILIDVLLANVYRELAADGIERMAGDLDLHDPAVATAARHFIHLMTDDSAVQGGLAYAFEGQVTYEYANLDLFARLEFNNSGLLAWVLRPLVVDSWSRHAKRWAAAINVFRAPNYVEFARLSSQIPPEPRFDSQLEGTVNLVDLLAWPRLTGRYSDVSTRLANTRAAAVLLGSRLYAAEHGNLPAQLSDLVPAILPGVPVDPFLADDQALHYRVDAGGPTVWSVGEDGRDDGADKVRDLVFGAAHPPDVPPPPRAPGTRRGSRGATTASATGRGTTTRGTTTQGAATPGAVTR